MAKIPIDLSEKDQITLKEMAGEMNVVSMAERLIKDKITAFRKRNKLKAFISAEPKGLELLENVIKELKA